MIVTTLPQPFLQADVDYPASDGMPMAESDFQRKVLTYAVEALDCHFRDRPDVYVSGNIFLYYHEGNPKAVVAPDAMVVVGAPKGDRKSYFLWREPKGPDWVLEVTSDSTRAEDQGLKHGLYAFLGVREYFQFDPTGDYLLPRLVGYRLAGRSYRRIVATPAPGGGIGVPSTVLGLEVRYDPGSSLAFYEPGTERKLPTYAEAETALREAETALHEAETALHEADRARRDAESRARAAEVARQAAEAARQAAEAARQAAEDRLAEIEKRWRGGRENGGVNGREG